jgi:hypothetical protein
MITERKLNELKIFLDFMSDDEDINLETQILQKCTYKSNLSKKN